MRQTLAMCLLSCRWCYTFHQRHTLICKEIVMSFFDNIVHKVSDGAKKAVDEATSAVDDISHGDIIGAAEHVENIREIPQDTAIEIIKDVI